MYDTFDEYLETQIRRLITAVENQVPESGPFIDVFDFFANPDKGSLDVVSRYGIRIFKMSDDIVPAPTKRYIEAAVYLSGSNYKATMIVCSGTKQDLLDSLNNPNFIDTLNNAYAKLLDLAESEYP